MNKDVQSTDTKEIGSTGQRLTRRWRRLRNLAERRWRAMSKRYCKYCGSDNVQYAAEENFADEIGVVGWYFCGASDCGKIEAVEGGW